MGVDRLVQIRDSRLAAEAGAARALREAAGLSLREVARELGVAVSTVQRWETGQRRPRGEAAVRYGELLNALRRRGRR